MNVKNAISITVSRDNLLWLKARAASQTQGNVSELIDTLLREARGAAQADRSGAISVVGTIDLPDDDALAESGSYVKAMFDKSLARPMLVRETPPRKPRRG